MPLSFLRYALWLTNISLSAIVVCLLVRRRLLARVVPFFLYVAFHLSSNLVWFVVWHVWPRAYYKVYWSGEAIRFVVAYLLTLGFWKQGLRAYRGIWLLSRWILACACVLLLVVVHATTQFGQGAPPQLGQWLNYWMVLMQRTVLFSQAVLLLAFFLVLALFRLRVSALVRGLALCWFGYSIAVVALYSLLYFFGSSVQVVYSSLLSLSSVILLAAWGAVVWKFSAEQEVEAAPIFAWRMNGRDVLERMELLNDSLLRMWKARA